MWLKHQDTNTDAVCPQLVLETAPAALCTPAEADAVCVAPPPAVLISNEGLAPCVPS